MLDSETKTQNKEINTFYFANTESSTLTSTTLIMCDKLLVNQITTLSFPQNTCYGSQSQKTII